MHTTDQKEIEARKALQQAGIIADATEADAWPLSSRAVCNLFNLLGYRIDETQLIDWSETGVWPSIEEWSAADVLCLGQFLEARRQWQPTLSARPCAQDCKKTPWQLQYELLREQGRSTEMFADKAKLDLRHALVLLAECDARQVREQLFVTVQILLDQQGFRL